MAVKHKWYNFLLIVNHYFCYLLPRYEACQVALLLKLLLIARGEAHTSMSVCLTGCFVGRERTLKVITLPRCDARWWWIIVLPVAASCQRRPWQPVMLLPPSFIVSSQKASKNAHCHGSCCISVVCWLARVRQQRASPRAISSLGED